MSLLKRTAAVNLVVKWSLSVIILLSCPNLFGTDIKELHPIHIRYTVDDGLASNFVVDIFNDSRGLLWIGTQNGLNTFNGRQFNTIDFSEVSESFVARICEAPDGVIWFTTLGGRIYHVENNKAIPHPANEQFAAWGKEYIVPSGIIVNGDSSIYLCTNIGVFGVFEGLVKPLMRREVNCKGGAFRTYQGRLMGFTCTNRYRVEKTVVNFFGNEYHIPSEKRKLGMWNSYVENTDNSFAVTHHMRLYLYNKGLINEIQVPEYVSNSLFFEDDTTLWLGTIGDGVYKVHKDRIVYRLFVGEQVHSVIKDFEGGFWIGTEEHGLIYVPNMKVEQKRMADVLPVALDCYEGKLAALSNDFRVVTHKGTGQAMVTRKDIHDYRIISSYGTFLAYNISKSDYRGAFFGEVDWESNELRSLKNFDDVFIRKLYARAGDTVIATYSNLYVAINGKLKEVHINGENVTRCFQILPCDAKGEFLLSTGSGITRLKVDYHKDTAYVVNQILTPRPVKHIFGLGKHMVLSSNDDYLHILDTSRQVIDCVGHLPRTDIWSVHVIDSFGVLLGTAKGLKFLTLEPPYSIEDMDIRNITRELGLPPVQVNDIELIGDTVFCLSEAGITTIPLTLLQQPAARNGKMLIHKTFVNGKEVNKFIAPSIYSNDNISFDISRSSFKDRISYDLEFRLLPLREEWTTHFSRDLSFYRLPADEYTLQIKDSYDQISTMSFSVSDYFYQKTWFTVLVGLFIVSLFVLPIYSRYRFKTAQARLESNEKSWRLRTLTSQLKPHFVFNALSSIQSYILANNTRASSEFLAKFSNHIRSALEQSRRDDISLHQALDSIRNYLELERLHLENTFDYSIEVDPGIDPRNIRIPVLLLQPYVENAVIHGVSAVDYQGEIKIEVQRANSKTIFFIISDNGKGLGSGGTKGNGMGTRINKERLSLVNELKKGHFEMRICPDPTRTGLCVEIKMQI